ncbi:UNVERIFIED_CONTAM: hypothetical protein K2H54_066675 [Gekko kuhli]
MEPGANTPPLPAQKPAKCRGKSWTRPEIKDLLALWGDSKTQKDLSGGKRNFEIFEEVAVGMAARGHSKNAYECRAKSKAMRLRYKKVVALNATSGHGPVTCPFYEELDHILSKSRDIHPEDGILQTRERGRRETETPTPSYEEASQELFSDDDDSQPSTSSHAGKPWVEQPQHSPSHPPAAIQVEQPQHSPSHPPAAIQVEQPQHSPSHPPAAIQVEQPQHSPSHPPAAIQVEQPQHSPSHPPAAIQVEQPQHSPSHPPAAIQVSSESHHTTDADDVPPVAQPSGHAGSDERPVGAVREPEEAMENRDRDPEELPPDVTMADLTAGERSALTKSRKKRVSALQSVGELIATQAREEHREAMRADERRYQEFLREMRCARQAEENARERMLAAMTESNECTRELNNILTRLVEAQVAHLEATRARDQDRRAEAALGAPSGRQWQMPPQALTFPPYAGAGAQAQDPLGQQGIVLPMQPPDTHAPAVQAHSRLCSPPPHLAHREYSSSESWVPGTPSTQMGTPYQGTHSPFGQRCSATATQHQLIEPPYAGTQQPPTPPPQMGPASQSLMETASRPGSAYHWFHAIRPPRPVDSPAARTEAGPSTAGIVLNPVPQDITPQETEDTAFPMEHGFGVQDPAGGRERAVRIKKRPQPYSP